MVTKIHPYKQFTDARKRFDRKPSASQDAVRYWWTINGTKLAKKRLNDIKDHYGNVRDHLEEMVGLYKEQLSTAPANTAHESASGWGKYARMLELHNGV